MRAWAIVAVLLLAGCSEAPAPPAESKENPIDNFEQKDEGDEGVEVQVEQKNNAEPVDPELFVTVKEPGGQPLADAAIDLLGTAISKRSDENGTAHFPNITAGKMRLRVSPAEDYYKIVEVNLTIRTDAITRATVTVPVADGLLSPPHKHDDAWARGDRVELFSVTHDDFRCVGLQSYCYDNAGQNQYKPFTFPAPVPPGTGFLEVTAQWESPSGSQFAMDIHGAKVFHLDQVFEESGDTISLPLEPDHTDPPHATLSSWTYSWSPDLTGAKFGTWFPPFIISITAVKGDYPLKVDPPHPDRWGGADRVQLADITDTADPFESYWAFTAVNSAPTRFFDDAVFPGTDRIEFRAWINHTLPHDPAMDLWYRADSRLPWKVVTADTADGVLYTWDVSVVEEWYDPIYAERSSWSFRVQPHSQVPVEGSNPWGLGYDGGYTLHVKATAVKQGT